MTYCVTLQNIAKDFHTLCTYSFRRKGFKGTLQHTATQHAVSEERLAGGHCKTLQDTARHCNTLQHAATRCNTLQHAATRCNTLYQKKDLQGDTARHCNTLQHAATHCNTLQHAATRCNTLQHTVSEERLAGGHCKTLQQTASHCTGRKGFKGTLHNPATHYNTLQQTSMIGR